MAGVGGDSGEGVRRAASIASMKPLGLTRYSSHEKQNRLVMVRQTEEGKHLVQSSAAGH